MFRNLNSKPQGSLKQSVLSQNVGSPKKQGVAAALSLLAATILIPVAGFGQAEVSAVGCGGSGDSVCSIFTNEFWANDSGSCDRGLKPSGGIVSAVVGSGNCVNDNRSTQSSQGSWVQWALREQRYGVSGDVPLNLVSTIGTHNSYSNYADGDSNPINVNQGYSITDQLNLGARHLRLDPVYYFGQMRLCHASSVDQCIALAGMQYLGLAVLLEPEAAALNFLPTPIPETVDALLAAASAAGVLTANLHLNNRLYVSAIREIDEWLIAHPDEVISLGLNSDSVDEGHEDLIAGPLATYFGSMAYTYDDFKSDGLHYPSLKTLRTRGKRVILAGARPDGGGLSYAYGGINYTIPDDDLGGTPFPDNTVYPTVGGTYPNSKNPHFLNCEVPATHKSTTYISVLEYLKLNPSGSVRTSEGRTASDMIAFTGLVNEADIQHALQCGFTGFDFDFFMSLNQAFGPFASTSEDKRREASIWSWAEGDYGTVGVAAMDVATGRWHSQPYINTGSNPIGAACANNGGTLGLPQTWTVVPLPGGDWFAAQNGWVCPAGMHFSHPRSAVDNLALQKAAHNSGMALVDLDYVVGGALPAALDQTSIPAFMDQGGAAPDPVTFEIDGLKNYAYVPVLVNSDPPNLTTLLNESNEATAARPIYFDYGSSQIVMAFNPATAQGLPLGNYGGQFKAEILSPSGLWLSDAEAGNLLATTSLHVMVPTMATLSVEHVSGTQYLLDAAIKPTCPLPATSADPQAPSGIFHFTDTMIVPGGTTQVTDLGWIRVNNHSDAGDLLGSNELQGVPCPGNTVPDNTVCVQLNLGPGRHMLAAHYLRDSLYNSSSSGAVAFTVTGGLSKTQLSFRMPLNARILTDDFSYNGSNKTPLATVVTGREFLSVSQTGSSFKVTVNPVASLTPGIHTGSIAVKVGNEEIGPLPVVVNVDGQLSASTTRVDLTSHDQSAPTPVTVHVNFDGGSLIATSPDAPWLSATVVDGSKAVRGKYVAELHVTASALGMNAGVHTGTLVVSQPGSNSQGLRISVNLDEVLSGHLMAKTVVSNLPGMKFVCDHNVYTAPYTFLDAPNVLHWCMGMTGIQQVGPGQRALFQNWENGISGIAQVLDAYSGTWKVNYQLQDKVTVQTTPACIGTVTPLVTWVTPGKTTTLEVTPNVGHSFIDFSGDLTGIGRTFTVTKPMNVVASFR